MDHPHPAFSSGHLPARGFSDQQVEMCNNLLLNRERSPGVCSFDSPILARLMGSVQLSILSSGQRRGNRICPCPGGQVRGQNLASVLG